MDLRGLRDGSKIVACTQADLDALLRIRSKIALNVRITYDRSSPENRWWHALVGVVAEGLGKPPEVLKIELKEHCQLWNNVYTSPVFGTFKDYKSVAFGAMSGPDFTDFRIKSVEKIFELYLPRVQRRDVYAHVEDLMGEPCPWQY